MNKHSHTPHGFPYHPENGNDHDDFREASGPAGGPHGRRRGPGPFGGRPRGGPGGPDREHHGRRSRRRGDVRIAVLLLLAEESMHGYQLMQTIAERTDGAWSPSPGAIYPTLSQLEDEGLVRIDTSGGRREVSLTEAGRAHVEEHHAEWPNPLATDDGPRLRELVHSLGEAVRQVGRTGTDDQRQQAARELVDVRRRIYLILAGDEQPSPGGE